MFPIRDENPTAHPPITTVALIGANLVVWGLLQGFGAGEALPASMCSHALIPGDLLGSVAPGTTIEIGAGLGCRLDGQADALTLLSHMFMHGGWLHLVGNLWFLWIFGDNVEDVMGPIRFACFYVICGLAAAAAQIVAAPASTIPMVGASGAIGGVMGAYALLYPKARVHLLVILGFFVTTISVPALFMLGYWFLLQIVSGLPTVGDAVGGVAFWAHAGGFLAGLVLAMPFVSRTRFDARMKRPKRRAAREWF